MQQFLIKRGFSDAKKRQLILTDEALSFESGDHLGHEFTTFKKKDIAEFRFGIRWIRFELTYGREYQIFIRDKSGKIIKITFKSYFRRKVNALHGQYVEIIKALNRQYFDEIHDDFVRRMNAGETLKIGDVSVDLDGVSFSVSGIASQKRIEVPWKNVGLKLYYRYFSIFDTTDARSRNRGYNFHEDWNAAILYDVLKTIIDQNQTNTAQIL
ncbi:hypothetical protein [Flavobacterium sp.]|uniref:hypothetical protein n=1 Tax=Flavobacterium sp. TaxID=239 RepID=UPI001217BA8B|nr:hypothetical protein [Flavobacterium sp.]RZJ69355.1 MAG: hypothetical protein EOO49_17805 [Flavobacterium sp.]